MGLDPRARVEFRNLLTELQKMGKTIFLSSHILADIAEICTEVGIIEMGQMVTHGNIDAIRRQMKSAHHLRIKVLGHAVEPAKATLAVIQGVSQIEIEAAYDGDWDILIEFDGDKAALSNLLKQLVMANVPVLAFTEEHDTLEDIFMKLTEGIVS
jgi:ABC-2 type transport system ATP-binding protein